MKNYFANLLKNNLIFSNDLISLLDIFIGFAFIIFMMAYSGITLLTTLVSALLAVLFIYKAKIHSVTLEKKGISFKHSARLQVRTVLTVLIAMIPVLGISHLISNLF
ncbi:hypothetical protein [Piscirickettsia salmonis]|uniref:hypothetical protein n=1 Tax=Piscirickettsia salmonis TaxID=1238 RepID=UPI0006BE0687|nr:hypothetical protein [Piscirickettsia salmonis]ALA26654.1 hypothetical protein KW89_3p28 [Piscirickettsia salmonis]APS45867.1 hypothetical protein AVI48_15655 [Piscirickettsia salmonis]APS49250.1 hypothetical protein AVI49_16470 [Piscirickettsia salmonis]QGO82363.1 hypothetical protein Psal107_03414 [Piscirickettsia salmonis]QGP24192.1 hypothetical protein Psal158_03366 [Piscirickettsia salmonis]